MHAGTGRSNGGDLHCLIQHGGGYSDAIHIPAWSWHRSGNDGKKPARFMSYSSEPMLWTLGMSLIEDRGREDVRKLPPRPQFTDGPQGDDPYARRLRRLKR